MSKSENGWTYVEFVVSLMIFSLLIVMVHPLLIVFKASDVEKQMNLQALWLAQEAVERQMGVTTSDRKSAGRMAVKLDQGEYEVKWNRKQAGDGLDWVEVKVLWQIGDKQRELRLERYILLQ